MRPVDGAGEYEGAGARPGRGELAQRFEAGHARHRQVEQENVRLRRHHDAHRILATARLAHHFEPGADVDAVNIPNRRRRCGEQLPQAGPEQALVIGQDHARRAPGALLGSRAHSPHEHVVLAFLLLALHQCTCHFPQARTECNVESSSSSVYGLAMKARRARASAPARAASRVYPLTTMALTSGSTSLRSDNVSRPPMPPGTTRSSITASKGRALASASL